MSKSKNILKNAISAILYVLTIAVVYVFLYKYLIPHVGIKEFGVYSLVTSTISVGAIANTALSESVVRFVALYSAKNDWHTVSKVLVTSTYILAILLSIILLVIYGGSYYILSFVIKDNYLDLARSLLPCGLLGFWLNGIASAFLSFFEGVRMAWVKNGILAISVIVFYVASVLMVPHFGLIGVVYANVVQAASLLLASAVLVYIKSPVFTLRPLGFKSVLFKEIISFSVNLQVVSIISILYEPVTKYFLARFGGISFVGYYEPANRMITMARSLIISATQILVPNMTVEAEKSPEDLKAIYYRIFDMVFSISTFMLAAILIALPYISIFWIDHFEPVFVYSSIILGVGWYINIIASPVYFMNYATNSLNINLVGQIIMAVFNPVLCLVLGYILGSFFVVGGWTIALISGAAYTLIASHRKYNISNRSLLIPELKKVFISLLFVVVSFILYTQFVKVLPIYVMVAIAGVIFLIMAMVAIKMDKNITYIVNLAKVNFKQAA